MLPARGRVQVPRRLHAVVAPGRSAEPRRLARRRATTRRPSRWPPACTARRDDRDAGGRPAEKLEATRATAPRSSSLTRRTLTAGTDRAELAEERGLELSSPTTPTSWPARERRPASSLDGPRRSRHLVVPVGGGGLLPGCATAMQPPAPASASSASSAQRGRHPPLARGREAHHIDVPRRSRTACRRRRPAS